MKKLLLVTVACAATAVTGFGQDGIINFNTQAVGAYVTDIDGNPVAGPQYVGQLQWGTAQDALTPVGTAVGFYSGGLSSRKGTVSGGSVSIPGAGGLTATPGFVQLWVWDSALGADLASSSAAGGQTGMSNIIPITPGGWGEPAAFPADLVGLESLQLSTTVIPEPSTFALGLIGIGALMLRRRK